MFLIQRGVWPRLTSIIGFCLIAYAWFSGLFLLQSILLEVLAADYRISWAIVMRLVPGVFPFVVAIMIGIVLAGLYPEVRSTRLGVRYRFLLFFSGTVAWQDIEAVVLVKLLGSSSVIVIAPPASLLLRLAKYSANYLYGFLAGFEQPIILLSPGLYEREQFIQEILKNLAPRGDNHS